MRICLVSQEYPPETARGGIGSQTWNKARELARRGHEVHVLSRAADPGPDMRVEEADGVTVHRMQPPGHEFVLQEMATYNLGYSWHVFRWLRLLMEEAPFDVIDFPDYGAEGFAYQLDRSPWTWAPVVVQLHGPLAMCTDRYGWPEPESDLYRLGTYMEDVSIKRADGLMACSANIADFTAEFHGVPRESIDVVECGVDAESFQPPSNGARANGTPTVLFVGNIALNKGVRHVLEAVLSLRAKYPDIRLEILGKADGDVEDVFRRRAREAGAADNVAFPGFVDRDELPDFYRRASVFASPAQHELGVANVYIEAMACACPVIAATTGGAPEAVKDGETGMLVPFGDIEATATAIDRILADPASAVRMGEAARRRVDERYAMDRYIERVLGVYEHAIARSEEKLGR